MKANELMMGDLVNLSKGNWSENRQVELIDIEMVEQGIYLAEPIPITPDILKKNGFDYFHKNYASLSYDHPFKIEMLEWPDENGLGGLWTMFDIIKIRFVHQLQHALRLCEIEKEIEL